ncbi:MAG: glycosyltransferase family 4 protein [Planctomycetaceae bacterium]|jgi:glycosyltransferase involved in cell wall biosynthesis|nr:glycosyltransferase family 4 protein [Planctomycetaceae bacterium]
MTKVIFDIAIFANSSDLSGVPRFVFEVLSRLSGSGGVEVVLICSLANEARAFSNLKSNFDFDLPFQSRGQAEFVFSAEYFRGKFADEKRRPTFLGRVEDVFLSIFPKSVILRKVLDIVRRVKWMISPPDEQTVLDWQFPLRSPFFEKLVMESDVYFSPFHPLISELSVKPSIRKMIVIHDLISVTHPELVRGKTGYSMLQKIRDQVTDDLFVFTDSENSRRDIERVFPPISPDKLSVIPLGASDNFCFCSDRARIEGVLRKYGIPSNCRYIVSVGSQEDRKNFAGVIGAFGKFLGCYGGEFSDLYLVIAGASSCYSTAAMCRAFGELDGRSKRRLLRVGYVLEEDLPFIYNGAECFCFMSFYEGFGLPVLEAMQSGTPVITSNTSSLPEVVGGAGIMLDPNDVEGLSDAFYRVLTDDNLREAMRQKGLEQAKKFNWSRCVELILDKINQPTS